MNNFFVKFRGNNVTHNIPRKLDKYEFLWIIADIAAHLLSSCWGREEVEIIIERNIEGKVIGSHTR